MVGFIASGFYVRLQELTHYKIISQIIDLFILALLLLNPLIINVLSLWFGIRLEVRI